MSQQSESAPADSSPNAATEGGAIQFDTAAFEGAAPGQTCALCHVALADRYFQLNAQTACPACTARFQLEWHGGSRVRRIVRAAFYGGLAAVGGSIMYYAISALTGYEFGLVSILVGIAVGVAVKHGAQGRGGWPYQMLAMILTYCSIVSTYTPLVWKELTKMAQIQAAQTGSTSAGGAATGPASPRTSAAPGDEAPPSAGDALLALLVLGGLILASPFLAGLENLLGIAIIAFGVYEAWKINRAVPLVVTGPFALRGALGEDRGG